MAIRFLFILILSICYSAAYAQFDFQARDDSEKVLCPDFSDLTDASAYYMRKAIFSKVFDPERAKERVANGLKAEYSEDNLELLDTPHYSAVCQKLNEKLWLVLSSQLVGNKQPAVVSLYFKLGNRYLAYYMSNNTAPMQDGKPPPPVPGIAGLSVFDENLNLIGRF